MDVSAKGMNTVRETEGCQARAGRRQGEGGKGSRDVWQVARMPCKGLRKSTGQVMEGKRGGVMF